MATKLENLISELEDELGWMKIMKRSKERERERGIGSVGESSVVRNAAEIGAERSSCGFDRMHLSLVLFTTSKCDAVALK